MDDCVLPHDAELPVEPTDRRHAAIIEVLCRIPADAYQSIVEQIDSFQWFVPHNLSYGKVEPVTATESTELIPGKPVSWNRLIYLSPRLEDESVEVTTAVVAHELAHIALNHELWPSTKKYDLQERQAFDCICKWGFEREAEMHRASLKRRGFH